MLGMPANKDEKTGRFKRSIREWNPNRWNEGFINNRGRFIVYQPNMVHTLYQGYVLRSYAVWKWVTGKEPKSNEVIHHLDGNKRNDLFENLVILSKKEHDKHHANLQKKGKNLHCIICMKEFYKPQWRLNQRGHSGRYCSLTCYFKRGEKK